MRYFATILFLLLAASANAATYYVDADAAAGGDGSLATPWDALADITADAIAPGDTILLQRGDTFGELLTVPEGGTAGNPIIIGAYGTGARPIITGSDTRNQCVYVNSKNYVTIQDLDLRDAVVSCLDIDGTSANVIVTNVAASGSGNQGFQMEDSASAAYTNITATDCVDDAFSMHDTTVATITSGTFTLTAEGINIIAGAKLTASDITISSNTTYGIFVAANTAGVTATIDGMTISDHIKVDTGCTINITDMAMAGVEQDGMLVTGRANINYSSIANCTGNAIYISGAQGSTTATLQGVIISGCTDQQIDIPAGTLIANNCIFRAIPSAKFGVAVRTGDRAFIKHCVFTSGKVGSGIFTQATATVENSIFYQLTAGVTTSAGYTLTMMGNCMYDNTNNFSGTNPGNVGGIGTDPAFLNAGGSLALATDFQIGALSPCVDAASTTAGLTIDFAGDARPSGAGYDIGAYEYQVPGPTPTPSASGGSNAAIQIILGLY
jgi:hypothetical protein